MLTIDQPINSVLSEDVRALANSLGIDGAIESGNQACTFCGDLISDYSEIFALFPGEGLTVGVVNRRADCIKALAQYAQRAGIV